MSSGGKTKITSIESDEDFDRYNLHDWDVSELDKLPDNRKSDFWKMSWLEVFFRLILFVGVVYINEKEWANPHSPNFIFAHWEFKKITYDPFPADSTEIRKAFTFWGLIEEDPIADHV